MGVCYILVSQPFWSLWVVSIQFDFPMRDVLFNVHYYSSLFNGRIHTNIHLFIHVIQSLFFSLFFLCMLVRILSSKIYFICFFLASFLIALIYYFYMVSELKGAQPCHILHGIKAVRLIKLYRVEEHIQSLIPLWRRACLDYKILS